MGVFENLGVQNEVGISLSHLVVESIRTTPTGSKRQRGDVLEQKREKDERMLPNGGREESEGVPPKVQRVGLSSRGEEDGVKGPQQKHTSMEAKVGWGAWMVCWGAWMACWGA